MVDKLSVPFKKGRRRGLFALTKDEKGQLELLRKEKMLKKKEKRKELLNRFLKEETEKENNIKQDIVQIQKSLESKGVMVPEIPKNKTK